VKNVPIFTFVLQGLIDKSDGIILNLFHLLEETRQEMYI